MRIVVGILRAFGWVGARARGRVVQAVGGPARARVIVLFGGVLALSSAQIATVGAVAPELEQSLHIGNTKIGLLNSVALLVGAVAVLPVGLLVDRIRRIPMLAFSMILWSATTILGAIASSYSTLLLTRVGLGAVAATAGPAVASLTGDYFPARERARVYGYILSGEIAGTAAGFIVSGTLASAFSWRVAFFVLALPGFFLARALWRNKLAIIGPTILMAVAAFVAVTLITPRRHADHILETVIPEISETCAAGASRLPNDAGLVYKVLGMDTEPVKAKVREFWELVRRAVTGARVPAARPWGPPLLPPLIAASVCT